MVAEAGFEHCDFQVMGLTSYRAALLREVAIKFIETIYNFQASVCYNKYLMAHLKKYLVDTGCVDQNKKLRLSNLFLMFQESAEEHSEILGIGHDKTTFAGRKWVITRYSLKINRMPKFEENINVYTYPGKPNPFFLYRHFYVTDENGNLLVVASSIWTILDAKTNKIVSNPFDVNIPGESKDFELELPKKINDDAFNKVKEHQIEYSDIDLNGHVNNIKYIELIQNIHDTEFYKNNEIDTFVINYFSEIKEKENVSLFVNKGETEVIKGSVDNRDCFKAIITYK